MLRDIFNRIKWIRDPELSVANILDKSASHAPSSSLLHIRPRGSMPWLPDDLSIPTLRALVNKICNTLTQQLAVTPGELVAIVGQDGPWSCLVGLAVMRIKAVAVPVNAAMGDVDLRRYLDQIEAGVVITDKQTLPKILATIGGNIHIRVIAVADGGNGHTDPRIKGLAAAIAGAPDTFTPPQLVAADHVLIVHTSGTTAAPKPVLHTSGSVIAGIKGTLKIEPIWGRDRLLFSAPFTHIISYQGLLSALLGQVPTWAMRAPNAGALLDTIEQERISAVFCFPSLYADMYAAGLAPYDLSSVRMWLAGADSSHEAHIKEFVRHGRAWRVLGIPLKGSLFLDTLGTSETGFPALLRIASPLSRRFGRYLGRPTFAGPAVRIADKDGKPVRTGEPGRVLVKGPTLFQGYWNAPHLARATSDNGWWWTGDIAYRDRWGRYFHLDRAVDTVVKKEGPAYTLPIEEIILTHPGVADVVVVGLPTQGASDMRVIALVLPLSGARLAPRVIQDWANARLPAIQRLDDVEIVDAAQIPRGLTGKVVKRLIKTPSVVSA